MNRRGFLGLALGLIAWRSAFKPSWEQVAKDFEVYRRQNEAVVRSAWKVEWFEKDFPYDGKTVYAVRATHRQTGEIRARGWRAPTHYNLGRTIQRREMKARMYAWAETHLG